MTMQKLSGQQPLSIGHPSKSPHIIPLTGDRISNPTSFIPSHSPLDSSRRKKMINWTFGFLGILFGFLMYLHLSIRRRLLPGIWYSPHHVPFLGNWLNMVRNVQRFHDWRLEQGRQAEALGKEVMQRAGPFYGTLELLSPRMVQYLLSQNFDNYEKGDRFRGAFQEILGHGIFNVDFEPWRTQRKIASHMFSAAKLNQFMLVSFKKHSQHAVEHLSILQNVQEQSSHGMTSSGEPDIPDDYFIDMQKVCTNLTMDAICEIGFGVQMGALSSKEPSPFAQAFDRCQEAIMFRFIGPAFKFKIQRFFGWGSEKYIKEGVPVIDNFIYSIIGTRKANAAMYENACDLLSLFLTDGAKSGKQLSDVELRDTILNFMIAGRDTTAALLSWFLYELSTRPEFEAAIMEEIYHVFGEAQSDDACAGIDEASLKQAVLLESALYETLRLHPPIAVNGRTSIKASVFPDGSHVPANRIITWAPYTFGRLKSIWGEDVDEFKLDRFLSEGPEPRTVVQKSQYAFPVFSAGFRLCLGKSMAILEAKTVLVSLLRQFRFKVKPHFEAKYKVNIVMFIKGGLPMEVFKREK